MTYLPTIESTSVEPFLVWLRAPGDPTGSLPEFGVTAVDATDPDGTWANGAWASTWNSGTGRVAAHSATVGVAGADLTVVEGGHYKLWVRYGGVVKEAGFFRVR